MPAFLIQLLWAVAIATVSYILFAPDQAQNDVAASGAEDIDAPTIDEGTCVSIIFGSVMTTRQNVSWYGGLGAEDITQQGQVIGHRYRITEQLSFCFGPIDDVRELRFNDEPVPTDKITSKVDTLNYTDWTINAPDMLGGESQEGGISGTVRIYKGTTTQTYDTEMATLLGTVHPAFRRVCYAVMRNMYVGTSVRLPPMSMLVERCPNTLGLLLAHHRINERRDANVICVIYEILTNDIWGAGIPTEQFDIAAWQTAGEIAYDEGLGISLALSTSRDLEAIQQDLLRYCDGTIYEDPSTGLITIKLIREADLADAPLFTADHISAVDTTRISWTELRSTVKATYTDADREYETGGVMAQNSAVVAALSGAVDSETMDLPGFMNSASALKLAEQSLRSTSYPISKVEITGDRSLANLRPGGAFRLQWSRPSIDSYYRVTKIDFRPPTDGGVVISAVEDVFAAASNTFTPPPGSGWENETSVAQPVTTALLLETPHYLRRNDSRSVIYGARAPNLSHTSFRAIVNGSTADQTGYSWMTAAALTTLIPQWSGAELTSITLSTTLPDDVVTPTAPQFDAGEALLLIGSELMAYRTVTRNTDGTVTFGQVARAVMDTVPQEHPASQMVYVLATARVRANLDLTADQVVTVAAQTRTLADSQVPGEATVSSITTGSRALRPLAPGAVSVNGVPYGAGPHASPTTISWLARTRAATQVLLHTDAGQTAEASTHYDIVVYAADGTTVLETHNTTDLSHQIASKGSNLIVTLHSRIGTTQSYQHQRLVISVTGAAILQEDGVHNILAENGDNLILE